MQRGSSSRIGLVASVVVITADEAVEAVVVDAVVSSQEEGTAHNHPE